MASQGKVAASSQGKRVGQSASNHEADLVLSVLAVLGDIQCCNCYPSKLQLTLRRDGNLTLAGQLTVTSSLNANGDINIAQGKSIKLGSTTDGHTFDFEVRDVDGSAYIKILKFTNANDPYISIGRDDTGVSTNTVTDTLWLQAGAGGAVSANFGFGISILMGNDQAAEVEERASLDFIMTTVTNGAEVAKFVLSLATGTGVNAVLDISNDETKSTIMGLAGDYWRIGDAITTQHSLNSEDDLLVTGEFETTRIFINQGALDTSLIEGHSSDVGHGMTTLIPTTAFLKMEKAEATSGGAAISGWKDADGVAGKALLLQGMLGETGDNDKTTSAVGIIHTYSAVKSGTTVAAPGADENLVVFGSASTARFIFDQEGSAHADVEWIPFAKHDDIALIRDVEDYLVSVESPRGAEHRHMLEEIGIIGRDSWHMENDRPRAMVNFTKLSMLHHGALLQVGDRISQLEVENTELKNQLIAAGVIPQIGGR